MAADANYNSATKEAKLILGPIITTVAGGAKAVGGISPTNASLSIGDGGFATGAILGSPLGVAVDGQGNLFIADPPNNRIRKVSTDGVIATVAGTSFSGYSGDFGQATSARLNQPRDLAVDGNGNVYIADTYNHRIRKVRTDGVIITVAGTGSFGFSGDGGQATEAQLDFPNGVTVGGDGNLYISDTRNNRIRKVDPDGVITTLAGPHGLNFPTRLAVDVQANLYIADYLNNRIRKVDKNGTITTVAGTTSIDGFSGDGGPATQAQLYTPNGVAVDGQGNLFIADAGNNRIRKVDLSGKITTVAGTGESGFSGDGRQATNGQINFPAGVTVDGQGNLYIADKENQRIRKVGPAADCAGVTPRTITRKEITEGNFAGIKLDLESSVATDNQWYKDGIAIAGATGQTIRVDKKSTNVFTVAQAGTLCPSAQSEAVKPSGRTGSQNGAQEEEEADQAEEDEDSLQDIAREISAWPNPVSGTLQVEGITPEARLQMLNIDGREINAPSQWANGHAVIDMQSLAPGTYVLRVADGQQVKVIRIVKSH